MIGEDLKTKVDALSSDQRHELAVYLTKLELENDPEYWKVIRERTEGESPERMVSADDL